MIQDLDGFRVHKLEALVTEAPVLRIVKLAKWKEPSSSSCCADEVLDIVDLVKPM